MTNNIQFTKSIALKIAVSAIAFILSTSVVQAQLSDLHYLPPLKMSIDNGVFDNQAVYISTPEINDVEIEIFEGTSAVPVATVTISNAAPFVYNLAGMVNNILMVSNDNTGIPLTNGNFGLRLQSTNGALFYCSFRGDSRPQGASLTSKGRSGIGTHFKWGSIPTADTSASSNDHNATVGIMATENGTTIVISDYNPNCTFRLGNDIDGITEDTITVTLDANEAFVLEAPMLGNPDNRFGTIGADISSNRPIVVSNGNLMVGLQDGQNTQDAGIDQSVPIENLGEDYIFIRGNGSNAMEFPVIIATQNATEVFVNGNATSEITLNEGDFFVVDGINYGPNNTAGDNLYVKTSLPVYAYQCTAGNNAFQTLGMNFIPPVSCQLPREVNNIPAINELPGVSITGGVTLLASTSTPDGNIEVRDANGLATLPPPNLVLGTGDWETYYIPGLVGNVSVTSSGPISVGYVGFSNNIGSASYFSGFDGLPLVEYTFGTDLDPGCLGDTIIVTEVFDTYQWFMDDILLEGETGQTYTPTELGNVHVEVTSGTFDNVPCVFSSNQIPVYYCDPEIVISKTTETETATLGDTVNFSITVQSLGIDAVTNINIEDQLPVELTFVSATPTKGTWNPPNWDIGTMTAGEIQSIEIVTTVTSYPMGNTNIVTNTAVNTQDQTDTNIEEDMPSVSFTIPNDTDNDGIDNTVDDDDDNDGILDVVETNADSDNDGITNALDLDSDNDGIPDIIEAGGTDTNNDGMVDYPIEGDATSMIDDNNNGVDDGIEASPLPDLDADNDGVNNRIDIDSDNDGLTDNVEAQDTFTYVPPSNIVTDFGIDTNYDELQDPVDTDQDGTPDYLDPDSDNDSILDSEELGIGTAIGIDTDGDGLDDGFEGVNVNDPNDVNDEIEDPSTLPDVQYPGGDVDFRDDTLIEVLMENDSVGPNIDEGFFRITNIELYPDNHFRVFNRWGVLVFETTNYQNGTNDFRGVSNGRATINKDDNLPAGVYFYTLEVTVLNDQQTKKGYLYVVR